MAFGSQSPKGIASANAKCQRSTIDAKEAGSAPFMAGRRHHHIWQMLQRGFASREHGEHHVWVYRKDCAAKRTVTRKFGQDSYFYGPEGSAADLNITDFENRVQSHIQDARAAEDGTKVDSDIWAAIVSHLEMRSLFMREIMSQIPERFAKAIAGYLQSPEIREQIMTAYLRNPENVETLASEIGLPAEQISLFLDAPGALPALIAGGANDLADNALPFLSFLQEILPKKMKQTHNQALERDFAFSERADSHALLKYTVRQYDDGPLILPDTTLAFFSRKGCRPTWRRDDRIDAVVVPISTSTAVVGCVHGNFVRDAETIRRALASCAYQAFLAKDLTEANSRLSRRISTNARLYSDVEYRRATSLEHFLKL
ncbi:hypothetical protein [Paracoccus sp. SCSIO 75233]|uniref:hypothetical protein n=1 Tax=Paracoccus sp. SCSIO 75233 TaxID=3017782 RepID=UPI0022F08ED4|nr:hypothetical protein [Paracoccus sp. SCSIO 75233]WBU51882.1 hypothetical protein PAF12_08470 [Paracoccus sp. SCSIO 75233]